MTNQIELVKLSFPCPDLLDKLEAADMVTITQLKSLRKTVLDCHRQFHQLMSEEMQKYFSFDYDRQAVWEYLATVEGNTIYMPIISDMQTRLNVYLDEVFKQLPIFTHRKAINAIKELGLNIEPEKLQSIVEKEVLTAVLDGSVQLTQVKLTTDELNKQVFEYLIPLSRGFKKSSLFKKIEKAPYRAWEEAYPDFQWPTRFIGAKVFAGFMKANPIREAELLKVFLRLDFAHPHERLFEFLETVANVMDGERYEYIYHFFEENKDNLSIFVSKEPHLLEPMTKTVEIHIPDEVKAKSLFF